MLLEVMIAVMLLAIASVGLLSAFDGARVEASYTEKQNAAAAIAEGELQRITSQPWEQIALEEGKWEAKSASTNDPSFYLKKGPCAPEAGTPEAPQTEPCYQYDWETSSRVEPLVTAKASALNEEAKKADPYTFSTLTANGATRLSGSIYRYITWVYDKNCKGTGCGGKNDDKRIVVAVTVTGLTKPVVITSIYANPLGETKNPLLNGIQCVEKEGASETEVPCTH
jgi:Tfp pilus assembly protein PilV